MPRTSRKDPAGGSFLAAEVLRRLARARGAEKGFQIRSLDRILHSIGMDDETHRRVLSREERISLEQSISSSVIPELMQRIADTRAIVSEAGPLPVPAFDADAMLGLLLDRSARAYHHLIEEYERLDTGAGAFLEGPVRELAVRLGEMWSEEKIGFYDVTLAVARLQTFVWELVQRRSAEEPTHAASHSRRILLARVKGEEHTLGLLVVTACFQEAGWEVCGGVDLETGPHLMEVLADQHFAVLGISASAASNLASLRLVIRDARKASLNPRLCVCVGGPDAAASPDLYRKARPDFVAIDAASAIRTAQALVS